MKATVIRVPRYLRSVQESRLISEPLKPRGPAPNNRSVKIDHVRVYLSTGPTFTPLSVSLVFHAPAPVSKY